MLDGKFEVLAVGLLAVGIYVNGIARERTTIARITACQEGLISQDINEKAKNTATINGSSFVNFLKNSTQPTPLLVATANSTEIVLPEETALKLREQKEDKKIKVLMLLWRGETDAENGFFQELRKKGYEVDATVIDVNRNLRHLKQILREELKPQDYDYIYTFGTLTSLITSEWADNVTPVIFNIVSYPIKTGLVLNSKKCNGGNLSGVGISAPMDTQITNAQSVLRIKTLAILLNPEEQNCLDTLNALEEITTAKRISLKRFDITAQSEIASLLKTIQADPTSFDAIYIASSSLFNENAKSIIDFGKERKIPIIAEELDMVRQGAFCGTVASYHSGGEMAAQILDVNYNFEVSMDNIPVQSPKFSFFINKKTAENLAITLDSSEIPFEWVED